MSTLTPNTSKRTTRASTQDKLSSRGPADELLDPERRKIIAQLSVYVGHQTQTLCRPEKSRVLSLMAACPRLRWKANSMQSYSILTPRKPCAPETFLVGHPLPSIELLNMQWALRRVLALSGAADATDEELDPPNPDWLQAEATDEDVEE
ncbi:hypothetical protein AtubIFM61612_005066 [Aspergillus tubingensis]|uniref:Uncharacterized protein n=1 Tax=Aspergillus niger TaxID=5061 RepID=A0A100I4Q7_ASPNG|nr:hypothetical protein AKAW_01679 [Aspergillus niger]GLA94904.1 hypothetical protein AtubIFM57143_001899 [Aspergillus tubingensis]GLB15253.1 hypothetical protein AtubIFM61612_005066 [Aspergillus tubingensis]